MPTPETQITSASVPEIPAAAVIAIAPASPTLPATDTKPLHNGQLPGHGGLNDSFHERRFIDQGSINLEELANRGVLAFLLKSHHTDQYYLLEQSKASLPPALYRIREENGTEPLLTIKKHASGPGLAAETIDVVRPDPIVIEALREHGKLVAVIEKDRETYKSKEIANCLFHRDTVRGLGKFLDVKADSADTMEAFVKSLGLDTAPVIQQNYRALKEAAGIDPRQLKVWQFHEKFKGYIMGVVSGTLTPLGFLSATLASQQSRTAMVIALLSVGLCDGMSDAVASSQATQSGSKASGKDQLQAFLKTMAGKIAIPLTFVPITLLANSNTTIFACSAAWAAALLAATAAIQAVANERKLMPAVGKLLSWGAATTAAGTLVGNYVPKILSALAGR